MLLPSKGIIKDSLPVAVPQVNVAGKRNDPRFRNLEVQFEGMTEVVKN